MACFVSQELVTLQLCRADRGASVWRSVLYTRNSAEEEQGKPATGQPPAMGEDTPRDGLQLVTHSPWSHLLDVNPMTAHRASPLCET